ARRTRATCSGAEARRRRSTRSPGASASPPDGRLAAAVQPDLAFALELADAADAITLARFRAADLRVETKPDLSPVSEADRAVEEAIRALASRRGEAVFGEEFGDDGGDVRWIVDPIDGTRN